jgi:hypothetical protein
MDERWVNREPAVMLETFHWYRGEAFEPIVEDLLALAPEPVVAEGFRLLPRLVLPLLADRSRAVWLLPTPEFRRLVFARRGPEWGFRGRVSDSPRAMENLLARDAMFTSRLRSETDRLGLPSVTVDGTLSEEELVTLVAQAFRLA